MCRYFESLLSALGPVHPDDARIQRELETFPTEAQILISQVGGIGKFLIQSLQFAIVEGFICLFRDASKARDIARQHRAELLNTFQLNNRWKPGGGGVMTSSMSLSSSSKPVVATSLAPPTNSRSLWSMQPADSGLRLPNKIPGKSTVEELALPTPWPVSAPGSSSYPSSFGMQSAFLPESSSSLFSSAFSYHSSLTTSTTNTNTTSRSLDDKLKNISVDSNNRPEDLSMLREQFKQKLSLTSGVCSLNNTSTTTNMSNFLVPNSNTVVATIVRPREFSVGNVSHKSVVDVNYLFGDSYELPGDDVYDSDGEDSNGSRWTSSKPVSKSLANYKSNPHNGNQVTPLDDVDGGDRVVISPSPAKSLKAQAVETTNPPTSVYNAYLKLKFGNVSAATTVTSVGYTTVPSLASAAEFESFATSAQNKVDVNLKSPGTAPSSTAILYSALAIGGNVLSTSTSSTSPDNLFDAYNAKLNSKIASTNQLDSIASGGCNTGGGSVLHQLVVKTCHRSVNTDDMWSILESERDHYKLEYERLSKMNEEYSVMLNHYKDELKTAKDQLRSGEVLVKVG